METLGEQIKHGLAHNATTPPHTALEYFVRLLTHPGRVILTPFYRHIEKRYVKVEKFEAKFLIIDLVLLLVALGIAGTVIGWFIWHNKIENQIFFEAQIAPTEIVSGAPSTLVLRYTNGTGQELKNVYLNLSYPAHFTLQELANGETPVENNAIALGNLSPDAVGSVKIRGIMFGDVGGEQVFEAKMTFTYGEKNRQGEKISRHAFSPTRSVLALSLEIPEKIVAGQNFTGQIVYKNTGEFALPQIKVQPEWPDNFGFVSLSPSNWTVPTVAAGEEGRLTFVGAPAAGAEKLSLVFVPSFVFGADEYKQETLKQDIAVVQPQIKVSHSIEATSVSPGNTLKAVIKYENIEDTPIYNVKISLSSNSPFAGSATETIVGTLAGHTSGETEVTIKLRPSIAQSETSIYEHLNLDSRATAFYTIEGTPLSSFIPVYGTKLETPITTPIVFHSSGRYATERGDQLGRGPLPPIVGEETKYWIFWNISGTTNEINNLSITGELPANVAFTGRQTVSTGSAVTYDETTKTVSWKTSKITPSFSPSAKIIGAAFEVAIIPSENQVGTSPTLISNVLLSGTDDWTGAWVTAAGNYVTTNLPGDLLANGLGVVIK
ncbi:MAG: hypothetical protein WC702_01665 [Patescibacteria group bacterium]|jgi:hypothetical protein